MSTALRLACVALVLAAATGCTNFMVTKGASEEGANMITYTDDGGNNYGEIQLLPAADHAPGTMRKIWRWEDGVYLGEIPEVAHTYRVVGNMNEHQLSIGETTFTGRPELRNPMETGAKMDYANLMSLSLQRARTAREAIALIEQLTTAHGYASTGESLTIADPDEIWHMEIVGKGKVKGAVWVARRVPDGCIGGHANQARITTFPHDDPEDTRFSADLVSWAKSAGYYPAHAEPEAFDFSAAFNPIAFHGARYGEVRVWDFFRRFLPSVEREYLEYAKGFELKQRMPLWVRPTRKVSLNATFWAMRSHFEGTFFDMGSDVGAGPYGAMMRARPTSWHYQGREYVNERPVAAQQTGWHFVAVMRRHLPDAVGGVSWFGVDDTSHGARIPVYCSASAVPAGWTRSPTSGALAAHSSASAYWIAGSTDEAHFSLDSAWWVHNLVANLAYARWTAHEDVTNEIIASEVEAFGAAEALEAKALALLRAGQHDEAAQLLTEHGVRAGQALLARWLALWVRLVVKYRDGFVIWQNASKPNGDLAQTVAQEVGYPYAWYAYIARDSERLQGKLAAPAPAAAAHRLYAQQLSTHECARAVCPLEVAGYPPEAAPEIEAEIEIAPEIPREPSRIPAAAAAAADPYPDPAAVARGVARGAALRRDAAAGARMGGEASSDGRTAGAAAALSYGMLLAAVGCSLLVGAAAGGGAVHWAEVRRRADYARASSSDGGCAEYRAF